MLIINRDDLTKTVFNSFENAKNNKCSCNYSKDRKKQKVISNNIPCYDINSIECGAYFSDSFVSFFADMRGSTRRFKEIGIRNTVLTMHALIPTMIYIIEQCNGNIVDLPGDGVMALFKGNEEHCLQTNTQNINSETIAIHAADELLKALRDIVNPLLKEHNIPPVTFGIGIDTGKVIVTRIGTNRITDLKAIGISIYNAAKHCNGINEICISHEVFNKVPEKTKSLFKPSVEEGWYSKKYVNIS